MDGTPRQMNNPSRVPSTLTAIDGPQEGAPRVIHPVGILVGRAVEESPMNPFQREPAVFEVPQDGTYIDVDGNPFAFAKGHRLSLGRASRFPDFNSPVPDARDARSKSSQDRSTTEDTGAVDALQSEVQKLRDQLAELQAQTEANAEGRPEVTEQRQEPEPENRMEPEPENRSAKPAKSSKKDDADGAQGESK